MVKAGGGPTGFGHSHEGPGHVTEEQMKKKMEARKKNGHEGVDELSGIADSREATRVLGSWGSEFYYVTSVHSLAGNSIHSVSMARGTMFY